MAGKGLSEEVPVELRMLGAWRMEEELEARHFGGGKHDARLEDSGHGRGRGLGPRGRARTSSETRH